MRFRTAILAAILSTSALTAQGQTLAGGPADRRDVSSCLQSYMDVGHTISRMDFYVTQHEISRGGTLTFQQAEHIRNVIYSESYKTRESIRDIEGGGDVAQCHALRDQADQIVLGIIRENF